MPGSRDRIRWRHVPANVRDAITGLLGSPVIAARNCVGGFSPGLAASVRLADGRRAFLKGIDGRAWPEELPIHREEAAVNVLLPAAVPAPRCLGAYDDGEWAILAFTHAAGRTPAHPWRAAELERVAAALDFGPAPRGLPDAHPRLGGWAVIAADPHLTSALGNRSPWARERLADLVVLERDGLDAARGDALVHFDAHAHNILIDRNQVTFVDWPHARRGAAYVDLVILLSTAGRPDADRYVRHFDPYAISAVLCAHAGFCMRGGLGGAPAGLEAIVAAKLSIGLAATDWLRRRIG